MEIIKDTRNELLGQREICILIESEKNPNFQEMRKKLSEKFEKPEDVVDVYNIKGSFGSHKFKVYAYIYDSKKNSENINSKGKKDIQKKTSAETKIIDEEKSEKKTDV